MQLYLNDVYASGYAHSRICERSLGILKKSSVEEIHKALDRTTIPSPQSNASALELLRYACLFWASHLHGSKDIEEHMTLVEAAVSVQTFFAKRVPLMFEFLAAATKAHP
jgi:hypothetical protein